MAETVNIEPLERSPIPVGTVDEAQAQGLDPTQYSTCSRPNKLTGNVGCAWFDKCIVSAKGQSGPKNYGIEIIKGKQVGGGFLRTAADCMWIADHAETIVSNKGSVKVVANEGEEYEVVTGVLVNKQTGKETFQGDPLGKRKKVRKMMAVPAYSRPEENEALIVDVLRAEAIGVEKERVADEQRARNYGLGSTIAPLDKRPSGSGKGRKAEGGESA